MLAIEEETITGTLGVRLNKDLACTREVPQGSPSIIPC